MLDFSGHKRRLPFSAFWIAPAVFILVFALFWTGVTRISGSISGILGNDMIALLSGTRSSESSPFHCIDPAARRCMHQKAPPEL